MRPTRLAFVAVIGLTAGCLGSGDVEDSAGEVDQRCTASVAGFGLVDIENVYLPHVLGCEIGRASPDTLRAVAVAARSYLYYMLELQGWIGNSTRYQVYSCGKEIDPHAVQAVQDTRGMILRYDGRTVVGFHVAGARATEPECDASGLASLGSSEQYITYNEGLYGDEVAPSTIGLPSNEHNRGCLSQNGARCLGDSGRSWEEILHFYYGEDTEITPTTATECGARPTTPPPIRPDPGFSNEPRPDPDPTVCQPDSLEPNDRSRQASRVAGADDVSLCRGDVDWYRVETTSGHLRVELLYNHAEGDLDLEVYSTRAPSFAFRSGSYSRNDDEVLDLQLPAGAWWLRVFGARSAENRRYSIHWSE